MAGSSIQSSRRDPGGAKDRGGKSPWKPRHSSQKRRTPPLAHEVLVIVVFAAATVVLECGEELTPIVPDQLFDLRPLKAVHLHPPFAFSLCRGSEPGGRVVGFQYFDGALPGGGAVRCEPSDSLLYQVDLEDVGAGNGGSLDFQLDIRRVAAVHPRKRCAGVIPHA